MDPCYCYLSSESSTSKRISIVLLEDWPVVNVMFWTLSLLCMLFARCKVVWNCLKVCSFLPFHIKCSFTYVIVQIFRGVVTIIPGETRMFKWSSDWIYYQYQACFYYGNQLHLLECVSVYVLRGMIYLIILFLWHVYYNILYQLVYVVQEYLIIVTVIYVLID